MCFRFLEVFSKSLHSSTFASLSAVLGCDCRPFLKCDLSTVITTYWLIRLPAAGLYVDEILRSKLCRARICPIIFHPLLTYSSTKITLARNNLKLMLALRYLGQKSQGRFNVVNVAKHEV